MSFRNRMNQHKRILGTIVFMLTICIGCEKENPKYISVDIKLVDELVIKEPCLVRATA